MRQFIIWTISLVLGFLAAFNEPNLSGWDIFGCGIIFSFINFLGIVFMLALYKEYRRRKDNGIPLTAVLETDHKGVKARMMVVMKHGHEHGIQGALDEFNEIFRNYPDWRLQDWDAFRSWYKYTIDHALANPDTHTLSTADGSPYSTETDGMYDPEARDWAEFDPHIYDDIDFDYIGEDYELYKERQRPNLKKAAKDGFLMGVGLGIMNAILHHNSGNNCNN